MNIELIHQWSACQSGCATDRRGIGKSIGKSNSNDNNKSKPNPKPSSNARTFFQCSFEVYL